MSKLVEPVGPWFINVSHVDFRYRPLCLKPVDYDEVVFVDSLEKSDCAACHREAVELRKEENIKMYRLTDLEVSMLGTM